MLMIQEYSRYFTSHPISYCSIDLLDGGRLSGFVSRAAFMEVQAVMDVEGTRLLDRCTTCAFTGRPLLWKMCVGKSYASEARCNPWL